MRRRTVLMALAAAAAFPQASVSDERRITITGHLGKVGARLVPHFTGRGFHVDGIDKRNGRHEDLSDYGNSWSFDPRAPLIHLAADASPDATRESVERNNVRTLVNVIRSGARRVIFASSTFAEPGRYGNPWGESHLPARWYGLSKYACEQIGEAARATGQLEAFTTVRIGWVPPPDLPPDVIPNPKPEIARWLAKIRVPDALLCLAFDQALLMPESRIDAVGTAVTIQPIIRV